MRGIALAIERHRAKRVGARGGRLVVAVVSPRVPAWLPAGCIVPPCRVGPHAGPRGISAPDPNAPFIRNARGIEKHAGGVIVVVGNVRDVCVTSWLEGQTNETACAAARVYP
jgi:hypothetical protein